MSSRIQTCDRLLFVHSFDALFHVVLRIVDDRAGQMCFEVDR